MKVVIKSNESDPGVTQDLLFQDKAIHKLRIEKDPNSWQKSNGLEKTIPPDTED